MKLVGLMPVRNEDWILGASLRRALDWVDEMVVLLHACDDDSASIVKRLALSHPGRVAILTETSRDWNEMHHRQRMLAVAREEMKATHIALIDADEILTANCTGSIRAEIAQLEPGEAIDYPMIPLWRSLDRWRDDVSVWSRSWLTVAFADRPDLTWKPESPTGYQHHSRKPHGIERVRRPIYPRSNSVGGAMHCQFVNWPRLIAKHALYKMSDWIRWPDREPVERVDRRYNEALDETEIALSPVGGLWWDGIDRDAIRLDGHPWQLGEILRLHDEHGCKAFAGLNLFNLLACAECSR